MARPQGFSIAMFDSQGVWGNFTTKYEVEASNIWGYT
jgi:hypothetical protein